MLKYNVGWKINKQNRIVDAIHHLPILRTCCELRPNSATKYSSENNSPILFAMVHVEESILTLILIVLIHAGNFTIPVSVMDEHLASNRYLLH